MKKRNSNLKAALLTAAAFILVCGLALAETLSVAKTEAKYGFEFISKGDEITFEKGDTLKAIITDPVKFKAWIKTTPTPAKGDKLTLIYLGENSFQMQWMPAGKTMGRAIVSVGHIDLN